MPDRRRPGVIGSASRNFGVVRRGNGWSAAANFSRPGNEVVARAVDGAQAVGRQRSGIWSAPGPTERAARVGRASGVAEWRSAILICLRMNDRSPAVTTKPLPTGPLAARGRRRVVDAQRRWAASLRRRTRGRRPGSASGAGPDWPRRRRRGAGARHQGENGASSASFSSGTTGRRGSAGLHGRCRSTF